MVVLYRLAALDLPRRRAERAVLLTAIFPFSFFFGAVYTESTFLLFTLLRFYGFRTRQLGARRRRRRDRDRHARDRHHDVAGAGLDRMAVGASRRGAIASRPRPALVLATLGFVGYCAYIYDLTGQPLLWATALTRWGSGYHPGGAPWTAPLTLVRQLLTHPYVFLASSRWRSTTRLYGVTALLFAASIPFVWRRFGAAYGVFMLLNLYVPLSSGAFEGLGRYCSVLFPAFIWLASIRRGWSTRRWSSSSRCSIRWASRCSRRSSAVLTASAIQRVDTSGAFGVQQRQSIGNEAIRASTRARSSGG